MIEIDDLFIYENKQELSSSFHCIIGPYLIFKENIQEKEEKIIKLCDELVERLINQGNYTLLEDGRLLSRQLLINNYSYDKMLRSNNELGKHEIYGFNGNEKFRRL